MVQRWRTYTPAELAELAANAVPLTDNRERACPACGQRKVRRYLHEHQGPLRTVSMSYVWCHACRRYSSSTGPSIADTFTFDDPAEELPELRRLRESDLPKLLDHLDELWETGVLPQTFQSRRKRW